MSPRVAKSTAIGTAAAQAIARCGVPKRPERFSVQRGRKSPSASAPTTWYVPTSAVFFARPMAKMAWRPQWWQTRSDDRAAVNWMERNHKPGDMVLVAFLSRFAVSWYADAPKWDAEPGKLAPVRLLHHDRPGQHCDPTGLRRELQGRKRVLLFIGPPFFQNLNGIAIAQLERLGVLTATHRFGSVGAVYEFDLTKQPATDPAIVARNRAPLARPDNCVLVKPYDSPY